MSAAAASSQRGKSSGEVISFAQFDKFSDEDAATTAADPRDAPQVTRRPSSTRGHVNTGWLNSYHTFSFGEWQDARYKQLHALHVINEDRIAPGRGFGKHPHSEFEIFSYIVSGSIRHADSMGHTETMGRGAVQFTSAGTGIEHSEENSSDKQDLHLLQLWVKPNVSQLAPVSYTHLTLPTKRIV